MSTVKARGGILQPSNQHQFRVSLYRDLSREESYLDLMSQVADIEFDLVSRKILLNVRDDCLGLAMHHIVRFADSTRGNYNNDWFLALGVHPRDMDTVDHAKVFTGCRLEHHTCRFDYASGEVAMHRLTISYRSIEILNGEVPKRDFTAPPPADEFTDPPRADPPETQEIDPVA